MDTSNFLATERHHKKIGLVDRIHKLFMKKQKRETLYHKKVTFSKENMVFFYFASEPVALNSMPFVQRKQEFEPCQFTPTSILKPPSRRERTKEKLEQRNNQDRPDRQRF